MSSEATLQLLYASPYVRVAGKVCGGALPPVLTLPISQQEIQSARRAVQSPFTAPPPAAVRWVVTERKRRTATRLALSRPPPHTHAHSKHARARQVTTASFAELLKSRTRPQRYGPAEIYSQPVTEAQVAGFRVALGKKV